jgi:hypothetical protein
MRSAFSDKGEKRMKDRGAFYVGVLLIVFGGLFLLTELASGLLAPFGIELGWKTAWPFIILFVGLAFWLPIFIWWDKHEQLAGLAIPATIVTTNGLLLLYQNTSGDWDSWAYLWTLEPLAVAMGLLILYFLGHRDRGLLLAVGIVGGIAMVFFTIFASAFGGGILGVLGPIVLIAIGLMVMLGGLKRPIGHGAPEE